MNAESGGIVVPHSLKQGEDNILPSKVRRGKSHEEMQRDSPK